MNKKICKICKLEKLLDDFPLGKGYKDGHRHTCKECKSKYIKNYYKDNKEKIRAKSREYDQNHKEEISAYRKQYKSENIDKIKDWNKEWRENNKEHLKIIHKKWAQENPDKMSKNTRKWEKANPEKVRERFRRRRARELNAEGSFTAQEWIDLKKKYNNCCLACGISEEELQKTETIINFQNLQADHVVPLSKGGTNYISNIQPLCGRCNDIKGTGIIDFREIPLENEKELSAS